MVYIRNFGREITRYTVIYKVYVWFCPTLIKYYVLAVRTFLACK